MLASKLGRAIRGWCSIWLSQPRQRAWTRLLCVWLIFGRGGEKRGMRVGKERNARYPPKMVEGNLEAPGREKLRSQIDVSESRLVAEAPRIVANQLLDSFKSERDPFADP